VGDAAEDTERRAEAEAEIEAAAIDAEAIEVEEELGEEVQSAALAIREERGTMPAPASVLPSPREWEASMAVAREIAGTQFVPESYRGKPDAVLAAILTGREMGIGPMQALRQIHMIDGRPAFSADLMMAKMRAGGVTILESSVADGRAYIKAKRKDTGEEAEVEWTTADAEKAGLLSKRNWKTYPDDMLWARVVGRLARRLGSDLLGGLVYAKEEMEDWGDDGGYGGDYGFDASTTKPFDPEKDLLPGAIQGEGAPKAIAAALDQFDPTVDWQDYLSQLTKQVWEKDSWREMEGAALQDFWRRLSNAVKWIMDNNPSGDIPPISPEKIHAGFDFAFPNNELLFVTNYKEIEKPEVAEADEKAPLTKDQVETALGSSDEVEWPDDEKGR
jgi:hypothetical protein